MLLKFRVTHHLRPSLMKWAIQKAIYCAFNLKPSTNLALFFLQNDALLVKENVESRYMTFQ